MLLLPLACISSSFYTSQGWKLISKKIIPVLFVSKPSVFVFWPFGNPGRLHGHGSLCEAPVVFRPDLGKVGPSISNWNPFQPFKIELCLGDVRSGLLSPCLPWEVSYPSDGRRRSAVWGNRHAWRNSRGRRRRKRKKGEMWKSSRERKTEKHRRSKKARAATFEINSLYFRANFPLFYSCFVTFKFRTNFRWIFLRRMRQFLQFMRALETIVLSWKRSRIENSLSLFSFSKMRSSPLHFQRPNFHWKSELPSGLQSTLFLINSCLNKN